MKRIKIWAILIVVLIVIWYGFTAVSDKMTLPPTTMEGHTEGLPASRVLKQPMGEAIQKHMLEHVNGEDGARGAVIINYDCKNYECKDQLVEKLEGFAGEFDFVYVAPFKNMKAEIVLTKLHQIKVLEEYDESAIRAFIGFSS